MNVLEFNSDRKRMSIIVKDMQNGHITLYCKGADSIIEGLLCKQDKTKGGDDKLDRVTQHIDRYANEGLRTLLLAKREI